MLDPLVLIIVYSKTSMTWCMVISSYCSYVYSLCSPHKRFAFS